MPPGRQVKHGGVQVWERQQWTARTACAVWKVLQRWWAACSECHLVRAGLDDGCCRGWHRLNKVSGWQLSWGVLHYGSVVLDRAV